ncbi:hypothetical protein GCM10025771_29180 [Niveibacterium umoris]|uniref:Glycosyltransferase family 1 protein n=1 Tax=Niveibacterium umoris TaxID=1193620 RepID=A0A840BJZ3_9RHOO|nr:hypothetical protein [Niveibacterium umoris]MBB4011889.1 hypothetical protein [Niveibacterium umoris]
MSTAIKIVYENHWNFGIHLADTLPLIRCGLELAGFRADIEKPLCPGTLNIVVENFDDSFADRLLAAADHGTRFIIVATEFMTGTTFNDFGKPEDVAPDKHYDNVRYWESRYRNFMRVAERAVAVWHLSEQQVGVYQATLPCPVGYLPHGYVEALRRIAFRPDAARDIDFLFTGTLTPYRREILDTLGRLGYEVKAAPMLTAHFHREDLVARTRVALNLRQHAGWMHPSNNRIHYHLNNGSLLLSEQCAVACDLDPFVARSDQIVEAAVATLESGSFGTRGEAARQSFATARPMGPLMAELVRQTLPRELVDALARTIQHADPGAPPSNRETMQ